MSRRRDWPDTLELQDKLNVHLLQGRRSAILLNKHIRRLKSVKAYILNEKAKVKTELTDYVNKLLESLLDFKSEMLQQLEDVVKTKFDELSMIKTGLEEDIDTLTTLCEETEKLLQFDSEITTYADVHRAETLKKAFSMVKTEGEQFELGDLMTLKFVPAVDVDHLNCKAFGTLQPPVSSNGSEESSETVFDNVLANLNSNSNASCVAESNLENSSKNHVPKASGVDINSNLANVQTDINSNLITNITQAGAENKSIIPGIDPAELAAYINELSLAQANNTLAYWLSQFQIQNIPLPDGSPQPDGQIQNIPLPDGSPQPVQQPVFIPTSPSQNIMSVPLLESLQSQGQITVSSKIAPQTNVTGNVPKQEAVPSSVPVLSPENTVCVSDLEVKLVRSKVREKTPPPLGFLTKAKEQDECTETKEVLAQTKEGKAIKDKLDSEKNKSKDETVKIDNKEKKSKDQKSKTYIREAKLNISSLGQNKSETIESKETNTKEKIMIEIKLPEYFDTASGSKVEKSLNDLEDSSDEDEWTESPADGKQEAEQGSLKLPEICENKTETTCKIEQSEAVSHLDTSASVEKSETKQSENKETECKEESTECASVTDNEKDSTKSYENEIIESTEANKEEPEKTKGDEENVADREASLYIETLIKKSLKIDQQARKPLRRPLSLPRIPYKSHNLNLVVKEDLANVSQGTEKASAGHEDTELVDTTELKSGENSYVNDKNDLPFVQMDEIKTVDSVLIVEKKENMAGTFPDSETDLIVKRTDVEDSMADNDKTSVFDNIVSPERKEGSKDGNHDDTDINKIESVVKETSLTEKERKAWVPDNRTPSEKNMDVLISQAQWCKKYIQKTLSPKMKKKNDSDTDISSYKVTPQDSCQSEKQSDNTDAKVTKSAKPFTDRRNSDVSETKKSSSLDSENKVSVTGNRRRVSSFSYVSESWDSELDENPAVTKTDSPSYKSDASKPVMSEKSREAMKTQATWCRKYIQQTLSPTLKKKDGKDADDSSAKKIDVTNSTDATTEKNNSNAAPRTSLKSRFKAETDANRSTVAVDVNGNSRANNLNSYDNKNLQGMTVAIPIKDVKQIVVPVSESDESWDLECTSNTNTAVSAKSGRTVMVTPVQRNVVCEKEVKPVFASSRKVVCQSSGERSVLEIYRRGNRKTVLKGTKITTVGSMGKGSSSGLYFPIGVTTNSFGDVIITDTGNHLIKMFDSQGLFAKSIGQQCFPPLKRPSAIVVNGQDEIFVKDDICIRKFDRTGAHLGDIGKNFFHRPYGLALTGDGILVVLETHYQNPSLVHLTQGGGFMQGYPYQPLHGAPANSKCRFMAVSRGTVIVSDLGLSQVYLTDLQGCFLQVVGRYGRGPMEFIEPSGIAVDRFGNFLVGDSKNNKIKIWQCDGTFLGTLDLSNEYVVRPSGIHLTTDNRLLVTNYLHHQVKIYQLEL